MWLIVMFDLPVRTKEQRKKANNFRLYLLDLGFLKCQLSVYAKFCTSQEKSSTIFRRVRAALPAQGQVSILKITDAQFKRITTFQNRINMALKNVPNQLELF